MVMDALAVLVRTERTGPPAPGVADTVPSVAPTGRRADGDDRRGDRDVLERSTGRVGSEVGGGGSLVRRGQGHRLADQVIVGRGGLVQPGVGTLPVGELADQGGPIGTLAVVDGGEG